MQKRVILIMLLAFQLTVYAQNSDRRYRDGELYLRVKSTFSQVLSVDGPFLLPLASIYQMDTCYRPFMGVGSDSLDRTYRLLFTDTAKTQWCIDTLQTLPFIEFVERAPVHYTSLTPNDIDVNQWGLAKINAPLAWNVTQGSSSVVVAIIDNGVNIAHEDLSANIWVNTDEVAGNGIDDDLNGYTDDRNGFDVADRDANPSPPAGISSGDAFNHGSHCAGIASASTNNSKGIASIGFNCRIMPVKCTRNSEEGNVLSRVADGITYAIRNGAQIISMSFGSEGSSVTEQLLMNTAISQGITLVAAAGNDNTSAPFYPASYNGVISVGATDQADQKASFSNFGATVDVMAPGVGIFSTLGNSNSSYGFLSGTSMACPLVAGLAALVKSVRPAFSPAQVEAQIKSNTDNIALLNPTFTGQLGTGRVNAFKTLQPFGTTGVDPLFYFDNPITYPNPFTNSITIGLQNLNKVEQVVVYNANGQKVKQINVYGAQPLIIETTDWPAGVYLIKLLTEDGALTTRVVKQ